MISIILLLIWDLILKARKVPHMSFYHSEINERMTIQKDGAKAKDYQVKQLRFIIEKHSL